MDHDHTWIHLKNMILSKKNNHGLTTRVQLKFLIEWIIYFPDTIRTLGLSSRTFLSCHLLAVVVVGSKRLIESLKSITRSANSKGGEEQKTCHFAMQKESPSLMTTRQREEFIGQMGY